MIIDRTAYSFVFTKLFSHEIKKLNEATYNPGLPKLEYSYWQKLIRASQPQTSQRGATSGSSSDEGPFSLGKRLSMAVAESVEQPQSLSYKAEFAKEYLTTARSSSGINILKVGLSDFYNEVTVVETHTLFQLFLLGTTKGPVLGVWLGKTEDQNRIDADVIKEERLKREKEVADLNAAANNAEPLVNDEFFFNLNMFEFSGHSSPITAISMKPDGSKFVSGSVDGEVRLWDTTIKLCLSVYKDHFEAVFALRMSPRDDMFASAGSERLIYLWRESSPQRQLSLIGHVNDVKRVEFTTNMLYLVSSGLDCTLRVWKIEDGECIRIVRTTSPLSTFRLTLNSDLVIAGTESGQMCLIDLTKTYNQAIFRCHTSDSKIPSRIRDIQLSPDEKVASIFKKGQLSLVKVEELYKIREGVKQCEAKEDEVGIKAIWQKEFKSLCSYQFEGEKLDFVGGCHAFNNTLFTFLRNKQL